MKALVLSGGKGTRLRPFTFTTAKQLIPVANKPILGYVLDKISETKIKDVGIIIAQETGNAVKNYVEDGAKWNIDVTYIPQEPLGLAHAVKIAQKFLGNENFIMCLGDNLIGENFNFVLQRFDKEDLDTLLLLKEVENPSRFGVAVLDNHDNIVRLAEKPQNPESNLAMVGVYLFSNKIYQVMKRIKPSGRGELEITDAIQEMVNLNFKVKAERLDTWWLDTGKKDDILVANAKILDEYMKQDIQGTIQDSRIEGRVTIKGNSQITNSTIRGPSVIGDNCIIENSFIGPYTSIGNGTHIEESSIEYCVVLEKAQIIGVDRLEESLIGKNAKVTRVHLNGSLKLHVGDYSEVEM